MNSSRKWHDILRYQREVRGWAQQQVAKALRTDEKRVSSWERGASKPSPHYRARLCKLYGKNAEELGLVEQQETLEPTITQHGFPFSLSNATSERCATELIFQIPLGSYPFLLIRTFAHPYPLQENFTGRVRERQMLTEWLTEDTRPVLVLGCPRWYGEVLSRLGLAATRGPQLTGSYSPSRCVVVVVL